MQFNQALTALDFKRIAEYMCETNWTWMNEATMYEKRVPTHDEIVLFVLSRLASHDTHDGECYNIQSGGFTFCRSGNSYEITFRFDAAS